MKNKAIEKLNNKNPYFKNSEVLELATSDNDRNEFEKINSPSSNSFEVTNKRKLYIESYGCQMNFSDSEIVSSILLDNGFELTNNYTQAELILINTCSIRDKAEQTIRKRLAQFNGVKKKKPDIIIGVLGCMAERLKIKLLEEEKIVDIVAGPDSYRDLPKLVGEVDNGQKSINTFLSREETYADINPIRINSNGVTAFISIMRGCDNMCSFCVVPFTRGRERSRDPYSIISEAQKLFDNGYREVTLLGQNVDSYKWSKMKNVDTPSSKTDSNIINFAQLLEMVAKISTLLRVRFSTSHPKDITDEVLYTIKKYDNICKYIHLPAQSGNSRILKLMNRTYTREWYLQKIDKIRHILGEDCGISSDMIAGFCSETDDEHKDTLTLMDYVQYDFSYMFMYSERPGTLAAKKLIDNVANETKKQRLSEIISKQQSISLKRNQRDVGKIFKVLVEGRSKKSEHQFQGRTTTNKVVIFDKEDKKMGKYIDVKITDCNMATLFGTIIH